jgi:hypothetical protein
MIGVDGGVKEVIVGLTTDGIGFNGTLIFVDANGMSNYVGDCFKADSV